LIFDTGATMAENDDYEDWQTALLVIGFVLLAVFGIWLYWRTGDDYKIRQAQKKLGYEVPPLWTNFKWLCMCCLGPYERRKWENEHKYWRNASYGDPNEKWNGAKLHDLHAPWRQIPPSRRAIKKVVDKALHQVKARVMLHVMDEAISKALQMYVQDALKNREAEKRIERIQALAAKRNQQRAAREAQKQQELAAMEAEPVSSSDDDTDWNMGIGEWGAPIIPAAKEARPVSPLPTRKSKPQVRWGEAEDIKPNPVRRTSQNLKPAIKSPKNPVSSEWGVPVRPAVASAAAAAPTKAKAKDSSVIRIEMSNPMTLSQLRQTTRNMTPESVRAEFEHIPRNLPGAAMLPSGADRLNRNPVYFPFPHTRVRVDRVPGSEGHGYINASYVRGPDGFPEKYIVTQSPLTGSEKGKRETIGDFWRMVWSHKSTVILMLEPTSPYWPLERDQPMLFGSLKVGLSKVEVKHGYTETHLVVSNSELKQMIRVTHYYFENWPADSERRSINGLLAFLHELHNKTEGLKVPVIIHDQEASGRAGTIMAIEHAIFQVETRQSCDVMGIVAALREDRGGLVQVPADYMLIHKAATMYSLAIGAAPPPSHPGAPPAFTPSGDSAGQLQRRQSARLQMA